MLHEEKLASMGGGSVFEIGGVAGMLLAGYLSVRLFRNSKPLTNTLFLALTIILLIAYWYVPSGNEYLWLNYTILILLGLSGTFSYIFGSIVATLGMGLVVDYLGWGATFIVLILSAVFAIIFTLMSRERSLEFEKE
ncbi:hypothetical protein [Shigella flexneri]|uniref:hypothetical protein n=1 Tax=Shigella flexneri TaxID=623 RepID=UPI000E2B05C5|nr:hypothetical protein [Shigella flexneri]SVH11139.1 invasion plasmid gene product [Shigella flexneri]